MVKKKKQPQVKSLNLYDNPTHRLNKFNSNGFELDNHSHLVVGIDEAGRGPVVGPLVYGMVVFKGSDKFTEQDAIIKCTNHNSTNKKKSTIDSHETNGKIIIKDSKQMSKIDRSDSYNFLINNFLSTSFSLHPQFISTEMDRNSLNDICLFAVIELLGRFEKNFIEIDSGIKKVQRKGIRTISGRIYKKEPQNNLNSNIITSDSQNKTRKVTVIIDSLGNSQIPLLTLESLFPNFIFRILPKADSLHQVVSAASIIAKVERDNIIERIMQSHVIGGCRYSHCLLIGTLQESDQESIRSIKDPAENQTKRIKTNHSINNQRLKNLVACNGYPSDPQIHTFLSFFPNCPSIRFKWATVKKTNRTGKKVKGYEGVYYR